MIAHTSSAEPWRVTIVETGDATMTGGRLKRVAPYLDGQTFCMTYGDCVSDVDIAKLVEFHREQGASRPSLPCGRPGALACWRSGKARRRQLRREARGRARLDQRRLLRARAGGARRDRRRRVDLGAGAARVDGARGTGRRLPAQRFLAADGHAARPDGARGALGVRRGAVEGTGRGSPTTQASAFTGS